MPIPPALLRRLYLQGSLRNRHDGFEFTLRNRLAPSTLLGLGPLTVNSRKYEGDNLLLHTRKSTRSVERVTPEYPFDWPINADITLIGVGQPLTAGSHALTIEMRLRETGKTTLTIEDKLAEPEQGH